MDRLRKIYSDIKDVKIQGATNIAREAIKAYYLEPTERNKNNLIKLRPTEPMLVNAIMMTGRLQKERIIEHFDKAQRGINKNVLRLINNGDKIYTHCHSSNVIKSLINAKKKGKKFEVYNTETRPLFQGRITAKELIKAGIKVSGFVDSGMHEAILKCNKIFIGCDAILKEGIINKVGSAAIADIAKEHGKKMYVIADSWKYSKRKVRIEERDFHEIWKNAPRKIKINNPTFEKVDKKYLTAIVSEYGILNYDKFIKKMGSIKI